MLVLLLASAACSTPAETPAASGGEAAPEASALSAPLPDEEAPPPGNITGSPILPAPVVLGAIGTPAVEAVVAVARPELNACYTRERAANPALAGKVLVRFAIGADGRVTSARTKSTSLWHPPTEECLNSRILALQFPAPAEGGTAIVTYPFEFPG